jgi:class 3 adenylate cyclase
MAILRGSKTIRFRTGRATARPALALIYDLAGFTAFANRPDAAQWVSMFLNHVSRAVQTVIYGGNAYWLDDPQSYEPLLKPVHQKFLGDGALYIWTGTARKPLPTDFITELCVRLRNLRANFPAVLRAVREKIQVPGVPKEVRFGLALGDVYELSRTDARQREFVGVCINLASRLQKYCRGIGFAAARVQMSVAQRLDNDFVRTIATNIDGFPTEYVLVDITEYYTVRSSLRSRFFDPIK